MFEIILWQRVLNVMEACYSHALGSAITRSRFARRAGALMPSQSD